MKFQDILDILSFKFVTFLISLTYFEVRLGAGKGGEWREVRRNHLFQKIYDFYLSTEDDSLFAWLGWGEKKLCHPGSALQKTNSGLGDPLKKTGKSGTLSHF